MVPELEFRERCNINKLFTVSIPGPTENKRLVVLAKNVGNVQRLSRAIV